MNTLPTNRRCRAFTLVEFLTVVAMIGIVLTIGIPGVRDLASSSRVSTAVNTMVHHLHYARSEALRLVTPVVLCPSGDGQRCIDSLEWQNGFILFADSNHNKRRDTGEPLLRYQRQSAQGVRILSTRGRRKLTYQATGMAPGSTATLTVCDAHGRAAPKAIVISNPGRPRLSRTRPDGSPLRC